MSLKDTVLRWAQDHDLVMTEHPVTLDTAAKVSKKYGTTGENLCQGFVLDETIARCANYRECNGLSLWSVTSRGKVVGLMLFSPTFSERAHFWGNDADYPGFKVQHPHFNRPHEVSDLLVFCARGGPQGVGQLLVLLALSMSQKGLFVQVGLIMNRMELTRDNLTPEELRDYGGAVQETYFVDRPYYSEAAFHIYGKLGFENVHVTTDQGARWASLYFYYPGKPTRAFLQQQLNHLDQKNKRSGQAARRMDRLQDQTENFLLDALPTDPNLFSNVMHASQPAASSSSSAVPALRFPDLDASVPRNDLEQVNPFPGAGPNQVQVGGQGGSYVLPSNVGLHDVSMRLSPGFANHQFGLGLTSPGGQHSPGGLGSPGPGQLGSLGSLGSLDIGGGGLGSGQGFDNFDNLDLGGGMGGMGSLGGPRISFTPPTLVPVPSNKPAPKRRKSKDKVRKPKVVKPKQVKGTPTCPECGKTFARATNMRRHLKTHFEAEEHACKHCDHVAHRRADLQTHMNRRHSRIKPYKCDVCSHRSGSLSDKYKHMEDKHKHSRKKRK